MSCFAREIERFPHFDSKKRVVVGMMKDKRVHENEFFVT
jgi:hypothetical protein